MVNSGHEHNRNIFIVICRLCCGTRNAEQYESFQIQAFKIQYSPLVVELGTLMKKFFSVKKHALHTMYIDAYY